MAEFDFYGKLHAECGVRYPLGNDQDWEFCAGESSRTGDYIAFYRKYAAEMRDRDRHLLINMIVQGIEDLIAASADQAEIERLWADAKELLTAGHHRETVEYWASPDEKIEDAFWIAPRMRTLL